MGNLIQFRHRPKAVAASSATSANNDCTDLAATEARNRANAERVRRERAEANRAVLRSYSIAPRR